MEYSKPEEAELALKHPFHLKGGKKAAVRAFRKKEDQNKSVRTSKEPKAMAPQFEKKLTPAKVVCKPLISNSEVSAEGRREGRSFFDKYLFTNGANFKIKNQNVNPVAVACQLEESGNLRFNRLQYAGLYLYPTLD